jgi:hypothetical protein
MLDNNIIQKIPDILPCPGCFSVINIEKIQFNKIELLKDLNDRTISSKFVHIDKFRIKLKCKNKDFDLVMDDKSIRFSRNLSLNKDKYSLIINYIYGNTSTIKLYYLFNSKTVGVELFDFKIESLFDKDSFIFKSNKDIINRTNLYVLLT